MSSIADSPPRQDAAYAVGLFDGVHLGHQDLLRRAAAVAAERGLAPGAVTFWPAPRELFGTGEPVPLIDTLAQRVERLGEHGARRVEVITFSHEFARRSGEQFVVEDLIEQRQARHLVVGHDFRYGADRAWGVAELEDCLARHGCGLTVVEPVVHAGDRVSSGLIRSLLLQGDVVGAQQRLGRWPDWQGRVERGQQLGRTLGFPTINLALDARKLLPAYGVYAARCWAAERLEGWPGAASIGVRPTVDGALGTTFEVFLLDFEGDLYDLDVRVELRAFLRAEKRFDSLADLQAAMACDVARARELLRDSTVEHRGT